MSIRKLFPDLPKPGKAGARPAMFLLVQLWTETILLWRRDPNTPLPSTNSHSSVTLNSPLILSWVTRPTSLNPEEDKSSLVFLFPSLYFAIGSCCDWLRGSNVPLDSDKAGAFLEWQKVGLAHSLCQIAY